jgi:hypothetical protein
VIFRQVGAVPEGVLKEAIIQFLEVASENQAASTPN